ncbi:MAG: hypothetical protein HY873_02795 [Chloroflexi bacterium]|nr:hypothetical protein [Chloroflexota bacterium]
MQGSLSARHEGTGVVGFRPWTLRPFRTEGAVEVLRGSGQARPFLPSAWRKARRRVDDVQFDERTGAVLLRSRNSIVIGTRTGGPTVELRPSLRREPASLSGAGSALVCSSTGATLLRVVDGTVTARFDEVHASISPSGRLVAGWSGGALRVREVDTGVSMEVLGCEPVRGLHGPAWSEDGGRIAAIVRLLGSSVQLDWIVVADLSARALMLLPSLGDAAVAL